MSNPHPDRPIAPLRRRLGRQSSGNSIGSTGSVNAGNTNPLAGFSFNTPTSVNPPASNFTNTANFSTGFGTSSTTGFGGFGQPPSSSTTSQPFGGFGNTSNTSFGFGATTTTASFGQQATDSNMDSDDTQQQKPVFGGFGTAPSAEPVTTHSGFTFGNTVSASEPAKPPTGFNLSTQTNKPFTFNAPATFGTPIDKPATTGFGSTTTSPFTAFGKSATSEPTSTEKPSPFTGFGKSAISESTSTEKPSPFAGFGKPAASESTEKSASDKPLSSFTGFGTTPSFSFGTAAKPTSIETTPEKKPTFNFGASKQEEEKKTAISFVETPSEVSSPSSTVANISSPIPLSAVATPTEANTPTEPTNNDKQDTADTAAGALVPVKKAFPQLEKGTEDSDKKPEEGNKTTSKPAATFSFGTSSTDKPSPFGASAADKTSLFGAPKAADEPSTGADKPSPFTISSSTDKPSPFSFSTTSNDKPSPFGTSATANKPSPFSFSTPTNKADSAEKPTFTFGTTPSTPSKKRHHGDDDEDSQQEDNGRSKKTLSFGSKSSETLPSFATKPPAISDKPLTFSFGNAGNQNASTPFTFGGDTNTSAEKSSSGFSFGTSATAAPATKESTTPTFSFGASAEKKKDESEAPSTKDKSTSATIKPTDSASSFSFGAPPSKPSTEKDDGKAAPSFTFGSSTKEKEKTVSDKEATSKNIALNTATTPTTPTTPTTTTTTTTTTTAAAAAAATGKPVPSATDKAPSLFSIPKENDTQAKPSSGKHVTFDLPSSSSSLSTPKEKGSVSIAFSKTGSDESSASSSATLSSQSVLGLRPHDKKDISSTTFSYPTTLQSNVTEPSQITYKTRFWELPDDARDEIALLAHFISEQNDKHDKIAEKLSSSFGSTLHQINADAHTLNTDAIILKESLEARSESLDDLILQNKQQRLNAVSAGKVQEQDTKSWRTLGAKENWNFFADTVSNMKHRAQLSSRQVNCIEKAVDALQNKGQPSPACVGEIINHQHKMYLSLAGRVAELHEEADRIIKRRKFN